MEGKPWQKTSWSFLRRQPWGFFLHPVGTSIPMAVQETLPERGLGRFGGVCAAFCPSTTAGFLHQLHQGRSWRCWSWWGAAPAFLGSLKPFQRFQSIFCPLSCSGTQGDPGQDTQSCSLAQVEELSPSQNSCRAGKGEHELNQLAPPRMSLQTKTEQMSTTKTRLRSVAETS